ncbi:GyrI-like domain-containing protein [Niabella yanshanensis]|uniref:GyrI-like domain-containing protein n=1 Tax=Niabella yanshanensis TaxID=577386 RepID=A0ABZ0WAP6_9BACT|nr:GyrI-like domain-containing protein [Niabella yanshanensis]WQD40014.1 GyrI-like domain-containing protein [Niabella yanshanensis]
MSIQTIPTFHVIGISVRTTNESGQALQDIPALWARFIEEQIVAQIPGKINDDLYCIYTDYEKDHTRPYTTLLGCRVHNIDQIPEGMTGKTFSESHYTRFTAKGNLAQGIVYNEWVRIWNTSLDRAFTADFEVYGEKTTNPENAEVDIFVALQ